MFNSKAFVAELIGTFALVFIGAGAAALGLGPLATALAFGLVVVAFAYAYGHLSGAHLNPAVTFGLALNGTVKWGEAVFYWIAQFLGAIIAAWLLSFVLGGIAGDLGATTFHVSVVGALVVEALLTFFLVNTVLNTAGNSFGGLAAGFALAFGVLVGFNMTGGSLNPARSLGPALFTGALVDPMFYVVYFVGPLVGSGLAVAAFKFFSSAPEPTAKSAATSSPRGKPARGGARRARR